MNTSIIRYILGQVMKVEALFLLLPCLVALIYEEKQGYAFLTIAGISGLIGIITTIKKPTNNTFYLKEGCVATALSWIIMSIIGCLPFVISGDIPSFTDALFETISGFTTTGASILTDVEALSYTCLFWRSFTHWIGGMGVLVFILAVMPLSSGSNINLMRAESPGPSVGKLVPKMRYTARLLYIIYLVLTLIEIGLLLISKMPVFDAITHSFGTAGTGGFGIKNTSITDYTALQQWIITVFMIIFGVNFNAYYLILLKQFKKAFKIEEVKYYFIIILSAIGIISINIYEASISIEETLRHASFQVASIITTTGYATTDFNLWPEASKAVLVLLMFIGACAGSTGGGIKVSRVVVMTKTLFKELNSYIHPKSIKKIKMDDKTIEHDVVRSINVYLITFMILFTASVFAISFDNFDFTTNFTAVTATINNIGPGLEMVGPTGNFSMFSIFSKYVLMFDMLAGRLELFPLLILFHPSIWKDAIVSKKKNK